MTGEPPPDPTPPPSYLSVTREKLTEASLRTASKGASALGRASDLVRRKLDERSAQRPGPPAPMAPPGPLAPPVTPAHQAQVAPYVPAPPPAPYVPAPVPMSYVPAPPPAPVYLPPPSQAPRPAKMNAAAVAAIIVAVIFPPAGLGLAKSARRECRESGQAGGGLALVAHVIAAAGTTLLVLTVLAIASAFAFGLYQLGNGVAGIGSFLSWIQRLFS
jgi:hypothetical protein